MTFEAAYAGSKITHIGIPDTNISQLTVDQLSSRSWLLKRVSNPFFGEIPRSSSLGDPTIPQGQILKSFSRFTTVSLYRNNAGNTNYHALHVKLEKRFASGFSMLMTYTQSNLIDDASSVFDASVLTGMAANFPAADNFSRRLERDLSTGDIPNCFVSHNDQLPFGPGRLFDSEGFWANSSKVGILRELSACSPVCRWRLLRLQISTPLLALAPLLPQEIPESFNLR